MYYFAIILMTAASMILMIFQLKQTDLIQGRARQGFFVSFGIIIAAALSEWAGVALDEMTSVPRILHALVKCIEFSLTPFLMYWLARGMDVFEGEKHYHWLSIALGGHATIEVISVFTGWIFSIDENNVYHRGQFYWIYILFYVLGIATFFVHSRLFSRRYQNRNAGNLIGILLFLSAGITIQMLYREIRVVWPSAAVSVILFYICYLDLIMQTDELTGMLNRRCYERTLRGLDYRSAVIILDVDDFKEVNDVYGHAAGDEILKKTAAIIREVYGAKGFCFRIGGDEFCVILKKHKLDEQAENSAAEKIPRDYRIEGFQEATPLMQEMNERFDQRIREEKAVDRRMPGVSFGYHIYEGTGSTADLVHLADVQMYENKKRRKKRRNGKEYRD